MAATHSNNSLVDRLSLLPPELVAIIFELSHDLVHPLSFPLSKRYLPYFHAIRYREFQLSSPTALSRFLSTIQNNPSLARLVLKLDTLSFLDSDLSVPIALALESLPSLRSLETHWINSSSWNLGNSLMLQHSALSVIVFQVYSFAPSHLAALRYLPQLKTLKVWFDRFELAETASCSFSLDHLEKLSLARRFVSSSMFKPWTRSEATLLDCLPNLRSLELCHALSRDYGHLLAHLDSFRLKLTSLKLGVPLRGHMGWHPCDSLLSRFPNLERLDLCGGIVTPQLASYLVELKDLKYLRLGDSTDESGPSPAGLLELIQGPRRLRNLETLVLDAYYSYIGDRAEPDFRDAPSLDAHGWDWPSSAPPWTLAEVKALMEACHRRGVDIKGSVCKTIKVEDAYWLDRANRVILRAFATKSLQEFKEKKLSEPSIRLPNLDFDTLDLKNLEIVKIDLLEEWLQLTLTNKTSDQGNSARTDSFAGRTM